MQRRTLLLGAAGLSFVLLLAIIGRNLRQSKRRNKLLAKQLDELQTQREKLYKTLAHVPSIPEKAFRQGQVRRKGKTSFALQGRQQSFLYSDGDKLIRFCTYRLK